jgi:glutamate racemase
VSTVTLVHAVLPALAPVQHAIAEAMPEVRIRHLLDEGLSSEADRRGGVDRACVERMLTILGLAVAAETDAVLLSCTAYSTMLPEARIRFPSTPLYAIDAVMVERAVARAARIGVLATFPAGLAQQQEMLTSEAAARGKSIEIVPSLHPSAMEALRRGDTDEHDRIIIAALPALAETTDVVLLAQASMARVFDKLPAVYRDRVLSSPRLAAEALRETLRSRSRVDEHGVPS